MSVTASLLIGSIPGVMIGAQTSARAPGGLVRRALAVVLLASGLKLVGAATPFIVTSLLLVLLVGPLAWMEARRRHGLPALASTRPSAGARPTARLLDDVAAEPHLASGTAQSGRQPEGASLGGKPPRG